MLLEIRREPSASGCTHGSLSIDGEFQCFTLEDVIREIPEEAVQRWKVDGETAIPSGTYRVIVTKSVRFRKLLPLLVNVPGFDGVRIHPGNVAADTEGCILVGAQRTDSGVLDSRIAFQALFAKIRGAIARRESVQIRITNPPLTAPPRQVSVI